ncbi:MAG: type IV secretion system DNA-binding domain-containing protein [Chloroflexota bacterium]
MNILLGRDDNNPQAELTLNDAARALGSYIIGTTGTGKTSFLKSLILQDIGAGQGVCVLDPHGDLIEDILLCVPPHRVKDVLLFNPADLEHPFGLNLFACNRDDPRERDRVTSTVLDTLYKLFSDSWGPRMEDLLRHSVQTLLYEPESTFLELLLILTDPVKRGELRQRACEQDQVLRHFWEQQFPESYWDDHTGAWKNPKAQTELVGSSLNKIGRFLVNPLIRHIIAQPHNTINFREAMDNHKVILINLSKGDIGPDNSSFLGSVLVNQLLLAALSRRNVPPKERQPFFLYCDEYQNFATQSFPELQSEGRKYRIITNVAHQYRRQLDEQNLGSTLNVANLFVFRVSGVDALEMARQFDNTPEAVPDRFEALHGQVDDGLFARYRTLGTDEPLYTSIPGNPTPYSDVHLEMANLLTTLPQYQAIIRILGEDNQLHQYRLNTQEFPCTENPAIAEAIKAQSRALAKSVKEVQDDIAHRMEGSVRVAPRAPNFTHAEEIDDEFDNK